MTLKGHYSAFHASTLKTAEWHLLILCMSLSQQPTKDRLFIWGSPKGLRQNTIKLRRPRMSKTMMFQQPWLYCKGISLFGWGRKKLWVLLCKIKKKILVIKRFIRSLIDLLPCCVFHNSHPGLENNYEGTHFVDCYHPEIQVKHTLCIQQLAVFHWKHAITTHFSSLNISVTHP